MNYFLLILQSTNYLVAVTTLDVHLLALQAANGDDRALVRLRYYETSGRLLSYRKPKVFKLESNQTIDGVITL